MTVKTKDTKVYSRQLVSGFYNYTVGYLDPCVKICGLNSLNEEKEILTNVTYDNFRYGIYSLNNL